MSTEDYEEFEARQRHSSCINSSRSKKFSIKENGESGKSKANPERERGASGNPKWENLNKAILRLWGVHNWKNDFRVARQVSWQLLIERLLERFNERCALLKTLNHSLRADSHLEAQVCDCTRTYWISWRGRPLFSEFSLFKTMVLKSTAFKTDADLI